jgi:hypothetical protein
VNRAGRLRGVTGNGDAGFVGCGIHQRVYFRAILQPHLDANSKSPRSETECGPAEPPSRDQKQSPKALAIDAPLPLENHERMVHKTAVTARLAVLASAGSGVGARGRTAWPTSRARGLGRAPNSETSGLTEESRFPRTGYVPQPTLRDGFRAQLLDTQLRVALELNFLRIWSAHNDFGGREMECVPAHSRHPF